MFEECCFHHDYCENIYHILTLTIAFVLIIVTVEYSTLVMACVFENRVLLQDRQDESPTDCFI